MAFAFDTVAGLVSDAAVELHLGAISDVYGSTDANVVYLRTALKRIGRQLLREHPWSYLQKEHTFATVQGTATYALPAGFDEMIDQTGWNRTSRLPMTGPLSPQEWQYLKGRLTGVVYTVLFRPLDRTLYLYPDTNTPGGLTIAYEYRSRYWVQPTGQSSGTADAPTANTDTILFDPPLIINGLRAAFLHWTGQHEDATVADADFADALQQAKDADTAGGVIHLGEPQPFDPLIGAQSLPITNYGS